MDVACGRDNAFELRRQVKVHSGGCARHRTTPLIAFRSRVRPQSRNLVFEKAAELAVEQTSEGVLGEAADVLEVLAAIAVDHGATLDTIGNIARRKRMERGGFDMRLWLDGVDAVEGRE